MPLEIPAELFDKFNKAKLFFFLLHPIKYKRKSMNNAYKNTIKLPHKIKIFFASIEAELGANERISSS